MSTEITIPYKFTPRTYQARLFAALDSGVKRAIAVYHRRAGKDLGMWNACIKLAVQRRGSIAYCFPEVAQARRVIWDGMDNSGRPFLSYIPEQLIEHINKAEMKITLTTGSIIQLMGSTDVDRFRGSNFMAVILSEAGYTNPELLDVIRPILSLNDGYLLMNSTPNGKNFFYDMVEAGKKLDNWFVDVVTVEDSLDEDGNRYVPESIIEEERASGMSEEAIQAEYYCSFVSNTEGYYYLRQTEKVEEENRRGYFPYNPSLPVETFWDIGVGDSTAIIFVQQDAGKLMIIDSYSGTNKGLEEYVKEIKNKPYVYTKHTFPHDMKVMEFGSGNTRIEQAEALFSGQEVRVLDKYSKEDGINSARAIFPRCFFDTENTKHLFRCLQNYHREYDKKKQEYKSTPVHDWSSHFADAFRYMALGIVSPTQKKSRLEKRLQKHVLSSKRSWMTS